MLDFFAQAAGELAANRFDRAIALYTQQISLEPDNPSHYWHLGLAQFLQGETTEAEATWMSGCLVSNGDEYVISQLGKVLCQEADRRLQVLQPHLSERLYLQVFELNPDSTDMLCKLGQAVALQGRLDEALAWWQRAIDLQPDHIQAHQQQAEVHQKLGEYPQAIAAYQQVLGFQTDWTTHYNLGLCFMATGQWQQAIAQLQKVIEHQPDFSPAYGDLGGAFLQLGDPAKACQLFEQALYQRSNFAATYRDWIELLEQQGQLTPHLQRNQQILLTLEQQRLLPIQPMPIPPPLEPATLSAEGGELRPQGYYPTTQAWAEATKAGHWIPLAPASGLELSLPRSLDAVPHYSFRFGSHLALPGSFVCRIPLGRFWLATDQSATAILTPDNQLLADLSPDFPLLSPGHPDKKPDRHPLFAIREIKPPEQIMGKVAVLAGLTNDMYFHWMLDILPRYDLLRHCGMNLAEIDFFLVSHSLPFQRETLQDLGIPVHKILRTEDHLHLQATELIVPSFPAVPAWMPAWVVEFLQSEFLGKFSGKTDLRLYISRQSTANRRIINETEIIDLLTAYDFQVVTLESLSVQEQAQLLARAKVVISPHGSGLTNLVFCQPGTRVIEIFSPRYVYHCYWLLSNITKLDYYYLLGQIPEGEYLHSLLYPDPRLEDILVDCKQLRQLLALIEL